MFNVQVGWKKNPTEKGFLGKAKNKFAALTRKNDPNLNVQNMTRRAKPKRAGASAYIDWIVDKMAGTDEGLLYEMARSGRIKGRSLKNPLGFDRLQYLINRDFFTKTNNTAIDTKKQELINNALIIAVDNVHPRIVNYLLNANEGEQKILANPNAKSTKLIYNGQGIMPLEMAFISQHGIDGDKLEDPAKRQHKNKVITSLIEHGADVRILIRMDSGNKNLLRICFEEDRHKPDCKGDEGAMPKFNTNYARVMAIVRALLKSTGKTDKEVNDYLSERVDHTCYWYTAFLKEPELIQFTSGVPPWYLVFMKHYDDIDNNKTLSSANIRNRVAENSALIAELRRQLKNKNKGQIPIATVVSPSASSAPVPLAEVVKAPMGEGNPFGLASAPIAAANAPVAPSPNKPSSGNPFGPAPAGSPPLPANGAGNPFATSRRRKHTRKN